MLKDTVETEIQAKKRRALDLFVEGLIRSEAKNSIAMIILFGSLLKGEVREESDIDTLVVATDSLNQVRDSCADAALETWVSFKENIESLIYCIDEVRYPSSYFLYNIVTKGMEVYRMDEYSRRVKEARGYVSLSNTYCNSAERNFSAEDYRVAIDTAYNSCELSAKGAILLKADDIPGSHGGVVNRFGELYIKTGEVDKATGRSLNRGLELRNKARYDPHAEITERHARDMIQLAKKMIEIVESMLSEK